MPVTAKQRHSVVTINIDRVTASHYAQMFDREAEKFADDPDSSEGWRDGARILRRTSSRGLKINGLDASVLGILAGHYADSIGTEVEGNGRTKGKLREISRACLGERV